MNPASPAIVLFGHGSRDPLWRRPIEAVAERLRAQHPDTTVLCAYLELTPPDLATALEPLLASGCSAVRIVPMFLGVGRHAREDLPGLVDALRRDHPGVRFDLQPAVGEDDRLLDLLAHIAAG
ncbi:CbiX/SirB N-terminal domain-containing protein [uncultured Xylophilus sp.]|uniref:sirohydrochlorin chelatase n=1 Tax=uncultured Xylophilus sp. TaxID=296832 RepID=UPI0025EEC8CD|nr:CbiX/SirB N-terminal domain-containing protein [uncultured Xylophilus sp.]